MQRSASRKVEDRSVLARSTDRESHAADCMDQRVRLSCIDLAAHAADINVDDVGHRIEMQIPHMLQQHRARHDPALVAHEIFEHLELPRQEVDLSAPAAHAAGKQVDLEITDAQHHLFDDARAATSKRLDASQHFRKGEGLDEIIVAAGAKPAYAIVDLTERADDQRRSYHARFSESANDIDAVHARKQTIYRDDRIFGRTSAAQPVGAVDGKVDFVAAGHKRIDKLLSGLAVVLHDQNST